MINGVITNVSAAIFLRKEQNSSHEILLALRAKQRIFGGYWEFPGGKIEEGETAIDALKREIKEELNIRIKTLEFFDTLDFVYPHAHVRINFFLISKWRGVFMLREHDGIVWQDINKITQTPILPANDFLFVKLKEHLQNINNKMFLRCEV